jgi:hypothetical protein
VIRLNSADQLAALMRVQVASLRQQRSAAPAPPRKSGAAPANDRKSSATDLASVAAERIRSIQPDDPQKKQKAIRIFLESVLLAELGPALITDPEFARMVGHVQEQLDSSPELALATQQAADVLLKSTAR